MTRGLVASVVAALGLVAGGCQREAPVAQATRAVIVPVTPTSARGFVDALALSPDGTLAAIGERRGAIQIWSTAPEVAPVALGDYRQSIVDLAFAPSGRLLASLGRHEESALRLWEPDARGGWREAATLPVERCLALRFDGSGGRLAVLGERDVRVLDAAPLRESRRIANVHPEPLTAVDLSADGKRVVVARHDGDVTVWDVATGAPVRSLSLGRSRRPGPLPPGLGPPEVWAVVVALSPDGARAAVVTIEGTVYVWDVASGTMLFDHADPEAGGPPAGSLRFLRDGSLLAPTGDRFGMRRIDVGRKASAVIAGAHRAFATVAITADAAAFATLSSTLAAKGLLYDVEIWRLPPPLRP